MEKLKNYIINTIYGFGVLFAVGSSVHCLNLVLKHYIDPEHDFLFISLVFCIFIMSLIIRKNKEDIEKNNEKIKKETTDTIFRIYKIKEKEEQ